MTPAARLQAAADILDRIGEGVAAEKALTNWARNSRFAGSKDRRAVRDHVFDCLRKWRSTAALGGAETGRARILGLLRETGADVEAMFAGQGHGPAPLSEAEQQSERQPEGFEAWDLPDWLGDVFQDGLGPEAEATAHALRNRAPVFLRVNTLKAGRETAQRLLAEEGIETAPHDLSPTCLQVTDGARKVAQSQAYLTGQVELQDAASQAVVDMLPLEPGLRVLDYCAGGGGKSLAMAAQMAGKIDAHDADPRRMKDLPARATRAGALVTPITKPNGPYDLVLCDVPCSGSGAWRRSPEGKWRFSLSDLQDLVSVQSEILDTTQTLVGPVGKLAYATCSVIPAENSDQVAAFLTRHGEWSLLTSRQFLPSDGGDGFFCAVFEKS
ncbi:RsmB/NOP family class I SAM-dependent RNA methyltransferase [uncultured Pelagimonas sp.]|uniref:RsmB/NOP family class I SAM-dependent RNA methyltransferase n=1 Tax=uncultured Pelagimonas sp. TaxID=1618102 RepID=UPI0026250E99|nr:RsmB/NOP family class I SAM-dependent RNA methyltransferase [uncultured Pelagimonas sp.]